MEQPWATRTIATLAALFGVVTGVGTVVGWVSTDSVIDGLNIALPISGLIVWGALTAVYLRDGLGDPQSGRLVAGIACLVAGGFLIATAGWRGLATFGVMPLLFAPFWAVLWVRHDARRRHAAVKACPDCAERVKVEARVCRHCGWRFERPPVAP